MRSMVAYETEEQQVEAIKSWWKHNGIAVTTGVILGIAALGGWRGWFWYQEKQAIAASDLYVQMQTAVGKDDTDTLQTQAGILRTDYKSTVYAILAALHEAKIQVEKGDLAAAGDSLRWVIDHSGQDAVQDVARIRLARVLVADGKLDEAATVIDRDFPEAYASLVDEIRGDIFVAKGETVQAKQVYDRALESADTGQVKFLQMKRDDLGN